MAVDFGNTIMEGGIEPSVRVQSPVEDRSGQVLAESLAPAARAIGGIAGSLFKGAQEDQNRKVLVQYENDLLDLADAVDQGRISRNEAMAHARVYRRQYLSSAPGLQDEFDTVWTDFASSNGLGNVVVSGTMEEQALQDRRNTAIKAGYTSMEEFDMFQARARELDALSQEVDLTVKSGQLITETQRNKYIQATIGVADSAYPVAQRRINEAMSAIESNPNNKAEIAAQLNSVLGTEIARLEYLTGNSPDNSYITDPIKTLMNTFNKWVNGEVESSVMNGEITSTGLKYKLMYSTDPDLAPVIAASEILGEIGMQNSRLFTDLFTTDVVRKLRDIQTPESYPNLFDGTDGSVRTIESIKTISGMITSDSNPELISETRTSIEKMIDGAYVFERSASNGAMSYKDIVNALGSPEISSFISTHDISPQHSQKLIDILQSVYETELFPAISRYYDQTDVSDIESIRFTSTGSTQEIYTGPVSDFIEPRWNGNALEFIPREEFRDNAMVINLANEATTGNNSMSAPINSLIRAYANLGGVDPTRIWEQDFAERLFGINRSDRVNEMLDDTSGDEGDEFTLGDFNPTTLEPITEFVTQGSGISQDLPPIDMENTNISGVNLDSYLRSIRRSESGGNDSAKNKSSSATGRYQFIKSTWDDLVNRYPQSGLTRNGRLDPNQQEIAIRLFTAENARTLERGGVPINNGTLYASHFLGAGDALKVLRASGGLVSDYVSSRVINANKFLRGMTVSEFKRWASRKGNA